LVLFDVSIVHLSETKQKKWKIHFTIFLLEFYLFAQSIVK
jgi:hypothetical protein